MQLVVPSRYPSIPNESRNKRTKTSRRMDINVIILNYVAYFTRDYQWLTNESHISTDYSPLHVQSKRKLRDLSKQGIPYDDDRPLGRTFGRRLIVIITYTPIRVCTYGQRCVTWRSSHRVLLLFVIGISFLLLPSLVRFVYH